MLWGVLPMPVRAKWTGYIRYMLPYLLVLMLPLIILLSVIYRQAMDTLRVEIMKSSANNLIRVREELDRQFHGFQSISFQISMMPDMHPFRFLEDPLRGVNAKTVLGNYRVVSRDIFDLLYYVRPDDFMFSADTSVHVSRMGNTVFSYGSLDREVIMRDLNERIRWTIYPVDTVSLGGAHSERLLTYFFPISATRSTMHAATHSSVYGALCFYVLESYLDGLARSIAPLHDSALLMYDRNGQLLYVSGTEFGQFALTADRPELAEGVPRLWSLMGEDVFATSVTSSETGIRLVSLVRAKIMFDELNRLETLMMVCIIAIVLIGGSLIYWFVHRNYAPLSRLLDRVSVFYQPSRPGREIQWLQDALDYLTDQNRDLMGRVQKGDHSEAADVLLRLMRGEFMSEEAFGHDSARAGLVFHGTLYGAAVILGPSGAVHAVLAEFTERCAAGRLHLYVLYHTDFDKCVLLFSQDGGSYAALMRTFHELSSRLAAVCDTPATIGLGRYYRTPLDIPDAYADACAALDYRFVTGLGGVISHSDTLPSQYVASPYPHRLLERFRIALRQRNAEQAGLALEEVLAFLKNGSPPLLTARGLCFEVMLLVSAATQPGSDPPNLSMETFSSFETVDELIGFMRLYCQQITQSDTGDRFVQEMTEFIGQNACRMDFSIDAAAARSGMSVSRFSHQFKTCFGCNFIDYVTRVKIERAQEMMLRNDLPLADIAAAIGYASLSSFIRRFKQITGTTPGEFMRHHRERTM